MQNSSQTTSSQQKIALTINVWKTKLLDLTKRNRALNFKSQKVSTVTIVDEQATEIFRILCSNNKSMKFKARPENQSKEPARKNDNRLELSELPDENAASESNVEYYDDDLPSPDFLPYDTTVLAVSIRTITFKPTRQRNIWTNLYED